MVQPLNTLDALLRRCTVRIDQKSGHGTGFFVAPGLIATCAHVVEEAQDKQIPITVYWQQQTYQAQIVEYLARPYPDLALLRLALHPHPCVYLYADIGLGDDLYSFGYSDLHPDGDSVTLEYEGPIGEVQPLLKLKEGQVRPGLSGAPLLNLRTGGVCGVLRISRDRNTDLGGGAIPTQELLAYFNHLIAQQEQFHRQDGLWLECLTPQ